MAVNPVQLPMILPNALYQNIDFDGQTQEEIRYDLVVSGANRRVIHTRLDDTIREWCSIARRGMVIDSLIGLTVMAADEVNNDRARMYLVTISVENHILVVYKRAQDKIQPSLQEFFRDRTLRFVGLNMDRSLTTVLHGVRFSEGNHQSARGYDLHAMAVQASPANLPLNHMAHISNILVGAYPHYGGFVDPLFDTSVPKSMAQIAWTSMETFLAMRLGTITRDALRAANIEPALVPALV